MVGTVIMMKMNEDGLTPEQRVDRIFSKMDKNHDDQITLDEFKEAAKSDPSIVLLLQCDMQKWGYASEHALDWICCNVLFVFSQFPQDYTEVYLDYSDEPASCGWKSSMHENVKC